MARRVVPRTTVVGQDESTQELSRRSRSGLHFRLCRQRSLRDCYLFSCRRATGYVTYLGAAVPLAVDRLCRIHNRAHRHAHRARPGRSAASKISTVVAAAAAIARLCANVATIGADLAGMSDAAQMLTGINSRLFTIIFGVGITVAIVRFRYNQIALVLKWLALALFCT